jgi:hypothetical protein
MRSLRLLKEFKIYNFYCVNAYTHVLIVIGVNFELILRIKIIFPEKDFFFS